MRSEIFESNALSYYLSYKCLMEKNKELCEFYNDTLSVYFFPAIALAAFSCELALKGKILNENETETFYGKKGHNLEDLFKRLEDQGKKEIIEETVDLYNMKTKLLGKADYISEINFYSILKENKYIYGDFRYVYEKQINYTADVDFLEALLFCLNDETKEYEEYLKTHVC